MMRIAILIASHPDLDCRLSNSNLYKRNSFVAHFDVCSQWATNTDTKKGYRCCDNPHFQHFTLFLGGGGRWGSNGEAEARIPPKINISFILATRNNTPSYKQKQSAEGAYLVEELSAARRREAYTTKKRKVKTLRLLFKGGRWGSNPRP